MNDSLNAPQAPHGIVLPVLDDPETAGFWSAAADGRLVLRSCPTCGIVLHLPRAFCARCRTAGGSWIDVEGRATLYSWTTVEHQVHPAYPTPYTVVLVELEGHPGVRMVGMLDGRPELTIGQPMTVFFQEVDGVVLPQWRPEEDAA